MMALEFMVKIDNEFKVPTPRTRCTHFVTARTRLAYETPTYRRVLLLTTS